jgi:hypothetical protein
LFLIIEFEGIGFDVHGPVAIGLFGLGCTSCAQTHERQPTQAQATQQQ